MKRYEDDWEAYTGKRLAEHMRREQDCAHVDLRIDALTEKYQSLDLVKEDIKALKDIRKLVSRRFLIFKGDILKECSSLDYDKGKGRCKELSSEIKYASNHLGQMRAQRIAIESGLEKMVKTGTDMKDYALPLTVGQISELSVTVCSGNDILNNMMIYFRPLKDKHGSLIASNKNHAASLLDDQAGYMHNMLSELSLSSWGPLTDFRKAENAIDAITKGNLILEPYLNSPHTLQILQIDIDHMRNIVNTGNAIKSRLLKSLQVYEALQDNTRELESLSVDMRKYGLSEKRLNTLSALVNSKIDISLSYTALQPAYDSEHKAYSKRLDIFVDDVIDMVDKLASGTDPDSDTAKGIMKFYEKINTFRDIQSKIKVYDEKIKKNLDEEIRSGKRQSYRIVTSKPKIQEPIVYSSIFDRINMIELPDDTRYWRIGDILLGKRLIDGWLDRLAAVESEIDNLSSKKDLAKTNYVLSIADAVKDSYTNGYLHELASMNPDSRKIVESSLNRLYSFGKSVAV